MPWPRPVPLIGDQTSAAQRATDPAGWALDPATNESLDTVVGARRDIRRFRPDPVPPHVLRDILAAGHRAPSVGHSQPWRFIVVQEQTTRDHAARLADRERLRQANGLTPDRRARLLDLKLDGIRDAPLGVVVACDRRTAPGGVLGRASFPDTDLWSCACAIENIWLTARARGLGLGWVTLFQPADLARLLHLPDGVETLGWLCLGWPDERPPSPGLERHGWSKRAPLEEVVLAERWPDGGEPAAPASHLAASPERQVVDPAVRTPHVTAPDQGQVVAARDSGARLLSVPGSLGVLDTAADRVLALTPTQPVGGTVVLAAGNHPVTRHRISAYDPSVTGEVLDAARNGVSLGASTARAAGLASKVVYAECAGPVGDLVTADAMSIHDTEALVAQGTSLGEDLATAGLVCLGEVGVGNTTVASCLLAAMLGLSPEDAIGLGSGADTAMLERKRDVVTASLARARTEHAERLRDPMTLTAALGGPEIALLVGVVLGAASRRAPIILDGLVTSVAALLAVRMQPAAQSMLIAGQCSRERGHQAVLTELGLEPLLQLRLRAGEGVGAALAAQLLLTAIGARATSAVVEDDAAATQ
ncbi:5,6-dimethylbenzimidazole synthase [Leekyejoonella antrihumi]|uniref:5,6-dimethylbenzimidazole synthase n=1 Tax=Leekyejoonella antrihumi TaxID=1660198 RepID=A0A563DUC0_9MICO|nr:5,6-dimethylbenzimidazole synthase [Leekyejoonella antrihumi]TWP33845.1 5,6-dimethylbenzimidazole synthase [Leekyejoonella antrihumi]